MKERRKERRKGRESYYPNAKLSQTSQLGSTTKLDHLLQASTEYRIHNNALSMWNPIFISWMDAGGETDRQNILQIYHDYDSIMVHWALTAGGWSIVMVIVIPFFF